MSAQNRASPLQSKGGKNGLCVLLRFLPPLLFMAAPAAVFSCSPLWELSHSAAFLHSCRIVCVEVALAQFTAAAQGFAFFFFSVLYLLAFCQSKPLSQGKFLSKNRVLGLKV